MRIRSQNHEVEQEEAKISDSTDPRSIQTRKDATNFSMNEEKLPHTDL